MDDLSDKPIPPTEGQRRLVEITDIPEVADGARPSWLSVDIDDEYGTVWLAGVDGEGTEGFGILIPLERPQITALRDALNAALDHNVDSDEA